MEMTATWSDEWGEYPLKPLSTSPISELLDYATNYGVLQESMPDGQQRCGKVDAEGSIMNRERRTAIKVMKQVLGILPVDLQEPAPAKSWKIVGVDNFDRETVADFLVAESIQNEEMGKLMVEKLNERYCNHSNASRFYRLVTSDYRLCQGMADLI
jgi:hypothetical protein